MEMQKEMVIKIVKQDVECKFFVSLILKNNNNNHLFFLVIFGSIFREIDFFFINVKTSLILALSII